MKPISLLALICFYLLGLDLVSGDYMLETGYNPYEFLYPKRTAYYGYYQYYPYNMDYSRADQTHGVLQWVDGKPGSTSNLVEDKIIYTAIPITPGTNMGMTIPKTRKKEARYPLFTLYDMYYV